MKSNIGHLEGASGVAGVIKTILSLEAGVIPPNSNFERLNPKIDAEFLNIRVSLLGFSTLPTYYRAPKLMGNMQCRSPRIPLLGRIEDCAGLPCNPLALVELIAM